MAAGLPTEPRSRLSRDNIVASAVDAVEQDGYESLSLRALARRLGVTAPALYDHFESKSDLLGAVASHGYERMDAMFGANDERAIARCRTRARAYVQFAQEHPELFRVMFLYRPAAVMVESDNELSAANTVFETGLADIAQAVADGDLVDREPVQLNLTLWAALHGVASIALIAPPLAEDLADDVIDAMFRGLAP